MKFVRIFLLIAIFLSFGINAVPLLIKDIPEECLVMEDSTYHSVEFENLLPIAEIANEDCPQIMAARIVGQWRYEYSNMAVYLGEYCGIMFIIHPFEQDSIWHAHNITEFDYNDDNVKGQDISTEQLVDLLLSLGDDTETLEQMHAELDSLNSLQSQESTISSNDLNILTSNESDKFDPPNANSGIEIELGKSYLFVVVPSKFLNKGLIPWCYPSNIVPTMQECEYCFRALNLKDGKVYPVNYSYFSPFE